MSDRPDPIIILSDGNGIHAGTITGVHVVPASYCSVLRKPDPVRVKIERRKSAATWVFCGDDAAAIAERDRVLAHWREWARYAAVDTDVGNSDSPGPRLVYRPPIAEFKTTPLVRRNTDRPTTDMTAGYVPCRRADL